MFRLKLTLKQVDSSTLALVFPLWFRIVFLGIASILLASMIAVGEFAAAPFIFLLIAVLSAGYTEAWYFSTESGVIHRFGIYPFLKTSRIELSQVDRLKLERFTRGRMTTPEEPEDERKRRLFEADYTTLRLVTSSGETINIDTVKSNVSGDLVRAAEMIAALAGKPLIRAD
jgi:hypothetical protein